MKKYLLYLGVLLAVACQEKTEPAPPKPLADFEANTSDFVSTYQVNFTNLSQNATTYEWDFGDGKSSKESSPKHSYATGGTYIVRLNAMSATQNDRIAKSIYLKNTPIANFEFTSCPQGTPAPCQVNFKNKSFNAKNFLWDFGDGNSSTQENPTYSYQKGGIFTVRLTARNDEGTDIHTKTVNIGLMPPAPEANFEINGGECSVPCSVVFTNISKNAEKYFWDFGDGQSSDKFNPTHEYTKGGTFTVRLTAIGKGGTARSSRSIVILNAPKADFEIENENCTSPCLVRFINRSTDAQFYQWEFSNNRSSLENSPSINFTTIGSYTVRLTAVAKDGKTSTLSKAFTIR